MLLADLAKSADEGISLFLGNFITDQALDDQVPHADVGALQFFLFLFVKLFAVEQSALEGGELVLQGAERTEITGGYGWRGVLGKSAAGRGTTGTTWFAGRWLGKCGTGHQQQSYGGTKESGEWFCFHNNDTLLPQRGFS
jgi:hypothetical protein